jgi:hypothetical protein
MMHKQLNIAILSFNRPSYLREVLNSLAAQLSPDDRCYLFQDGGWNPHSGIHRAAESVISECVEIFARIIPAGRAFVSTVNLGIAGNYQRAEDFIFNVLGAQEALFLEDDLVLSPNYLEVTGDLLCIATDHPSVGYVSAYGDLWASLETQAEHESQLQLMHENWGSALTRESWLKQKSIRAMYWEFVENCDYQQRNGRKIIQLYRNLGYNMPYTSQDASRWVACADCNLVRLTTRTCHARYIGEVGVHMHAADYTKYRFANTVWYPRRPKIVTPTEERLHSWGLEQKAKIVKGYIHSYRIDARHWSQSLPTGFE